MFQPLNDAEIAQLDELLLKYSNDDSILNVSGLDGFLTAIVSGPEAIVPSRWYPLLWGGAGREPVWESAEELKQFQGLLMRHMNEIAVCLMNYPQHFSAMFYENEDEGRTIYVAEDWCFGYMMIVDAMEWPELPDEAMVWLEAIDFHGREEHFDVLSTLTLEEHQQTVADIEPAAVNLHAYWLAQRTPATPGPARVEPKIGRNSPCPCGSGKKFKHCCLH